MNENIIAATILAVGLVLTAAILTRSNGIKVRVYFDNSSSQLVKQEYQSPCKNPEIGRYQRFSRSDDVSSESGCFDTATGLEYRHAVVPGAKVNKFIKADYKSGQNIILSDDWK